MYTVKRLFFTKIVSHRKLLLLLYIIVKHSLRGSMQFRTRGRCYDYKLSHQLSAKVQCCTPQPHPTRTLSTSTTTSQQKHRSLSFPSATFKDRMVSFRCNMNSGANDETAAAEDLDLTMLLPYPALFSVMLHRIMTFVPVKLYTQTVYSYNKCGRITLQCGGIHYITVWRDPLHYSVAGSITLQCGGITLQCGRITL